jgi:ATP-dependent DNA ligase
VGKLASGRYHADGTSNNWCKIKNPAYTQMTARHELFERRTSSHKSRAMLRVP